METLSRRAVGDRKTQPETSMRETRVPFGQAHRRCATSTRAFHLDSALTHMSLQQNENRTHADSTVVLLCLHRRILQAIISFNVLFRVYLIGIFTGAGRTRFSIFLPSTGNFACTRSATAIMSLFVWASRCAAYSYYTTCFSPYFQKLGRENSLPTSLQPTCHHARHTQLISIESLQLCQSVVNYSGRFKYPMAIEQKPAKVLLACKLPTTGLLFYLL